MSINTGINFNLTSGLSVGAKPLYQWNARVTGSEIMLYNKDGEEVANSYTSNGDCITVLDVSSENNLALIQLPCNSTSCYVQGYIKVSDFNLLEFRFKDLWVNSTTGQQIELINGTIAKTALALNDGVTFLYSADNYGCILYLNKNGSFESGYVPLTSGNLNIIQTNIPFYLAPGESVGENPTYPPNAINFSTQIDIVDINKILIPNTYTSQGDEITVLKIYPNEELILIEFPDSANNTYIIGYIPLDNLSNNIVLRSNYSNFNSDASYRAIYDLNKTQVYSVPTDQTIEYLFQTPSFACILFNNNNISGYPLQTAFMSLEYGSFGFNTPSVSNISLIEKAAIYIACNEGFSASPYYYGSGIYGNSIGYGSYYTEENFPKIPITPTYAFDYLINYLEENIESWNNTISQYLDLNTLNDSQLVALYDFAYNLPAYLGDIASSLSSNPSWGNTFGNFLIPSAIYDRRMREWLTFTKSEYFLGGAISELPNDNYISIANSMDYII